MNDNEFQLADGEVQDLRRALFGGEAADDAERRANGRFVYPAIQLILPLAAGRPIDARSLCKVQCHDISRGGVSFYWPVKPDFTHICLALGGQTNPTWVKARVVHSRQTPDHEARFLVGCAFTERIYSFPIGFFEE